MQGIFFFELVEMVESMFPPELSDAMLDESALQSRGVYTAGGPVQSVSIAQDIAAYPQKLL